MDIHRGAVIAAGPLEAEISCCIHCGGSAVIRRRLPVSSHAMTSTQDSHQQVFFESSLIAPATLRFYDFLISIMPSRLIYNIARWRKSRSPDRWIEVYMLLSTAALVVLWIGAGLSVRPLWLGRIIGAVGLAVAAVRWLEILAASLELVVGRVRASAETAIAVLVVYLPQTVLMFSIAAEVLAPKGFASSAEGPHPTGILSFLYISWTNISTLGNDFAATSRMAKVIVIMSGFTGVLLLGVFLTYAIGQFSGQVGTNSRLTDSGGRKD